MVAHVGEGRGAQDFFDEGGDVTVVEVFDLAALGADEVVMMVPALKFVVGMAMAQVDLAGDVFFDERIQDAVDGHLIGKAFWDFYGDFFGREGLFGAFKDSEDSEAGLGLAQFGRGEDTHVFWICPREVSYFFVQKKIASRIAWNRFFHRDRG